MIVTVRQEIALVLTIRGKWLGRVVFSFIVVETATARVGQTNQIVGVRHIALGRVVSHRMTQWQKTVVVILLILVDHCAGTGL